METIDFNLNNYFLVKLEELGYQKLADEQNELLKDFPNYEKVNPEYFKNKADENGYTHFQAWDFMEKFGKYMTMGFHGMFNNDIKIQFKNGNSER